MSVVDLSRTRLRDVLWLAAFAVGNFVAAGAHGAISPQPAGVAADAAAAAAPAASGHSRARAHRD